MPQRPFTRVVVLALAIACWPGGEGTAQTVDSPLVPRGALVLRLAPQATTLDDVFGSSGRTPLGASFRGVEVGSANVPALVPVADRFAALAGEGSTGGLTLGTTRARFAGDERSLPIGLSYGVLDRLTVGVTVPLIRKRVETVFALSPTGADVGSNPQLTDSGAVSSFLLDAGASLSEVTEAVDAACLAGGEEDPDCVSGRALITGATAFLDELGAAYTDETVFPLSGSSLGTGIMGRWTEFVTGFSDWGANGPEAIPLASAPVSQETFESLAVDPAWPAGGFPLDTPDAVLGLGDVEIHAAFGILEPELETDGGPVDGIQVALAVVGTARFGTGEPDSLRVVAPMEPPRGTGGFSLRTVGDVLLSGRFAVLGVLEGGWNGSTETTLLAPDPTRLFSPGYHATRVRWTPGSHVRLRVAPRFRLGPGLSIGAGWETLRRSADEFETISANGEDPVPLAFSPDDVTFHSASLELRYAAMDEIFEDRVPFPFEVLFRASRAVAGAEGSPAHTRVEAMVRFRIRDL